MVDDRFSQCRLEPHLVCDMGFRCLLCVKAENTWADTGVKAAEAGRRTLPEEEQPIRDAVVETSR